MSVELLPCPFCGGHGVRVTAHIMAAYCIRCQQCGAQAPGVNDWNRRAEDHAAGKLEGYRKGLAAAMTIALENEVCHVCGCELLAPAGKPYCEDTCHSRSDPAEGEDYDIYHGNYIPTSERICALLTTDVKGSDGNG